jgi:hypothetical protein
MSEIPKYDSEGNYHDDDIRIEAYAEVADIKPEFVDKVVQNIQMEVGQQLVQNPSMSVNEIKIQAMNRFIDLIEKQLLTQREADRCYQRFVQMVHYYYGS